MKRAGLCGLVLLGLALAPAVGRAFVEYRSLGGRILNWDIVGLGGSLPYLINPTKDADPLGGPDVISEFQRSFAVWVPPAVPTTQAGVLYGGTTAINTYGFISGGTTGDGSNVLLFVKNDPDLAGGILAITMTLYDVSTGQIAEADIAFNDDYVWRTDGSGDGVNTFEVATVAIHEMGHFFGLDHSFTAEVAGAFNATIATTLWPYEFGLQEQTIEDDDIAGVTFLFPDPVTRPAAFGSISGRVSNWRKIPLFGAHVVAITAAGKIPTVARLTLTDGTYLIDNLPPGDYYVYAQTALVNGQPFTNFVSGFWSGADLIQPMELFDNVRLSSLTQLADGNAVFDDATLVTVAVGATRTGVDFIIGAPPPTADWAEFEFDSRSRGCGDLAASGPAGGPAWLAPLAAWAALRFRRRR